MNRIFVIKGSTFMGTFRFVWVLISTAWVMGLFHPVSRPLALSMVAVSVGIAVIASWPEYYKGAALAVGIITLSTVFHVGTHLFQQGQVSTFWLLLGGMMVILLIISTAVFFLEYRKRQEVSNF